MCSFSYRHIILEMFVDYSSTSYDNITEEKGKYLCGENGVQARSSWLLQ